MTLISKVPASIKSLPGFCKVAAHASLALQTSGYNCCLTRSSHGNGINLDQRPRHPQAPTNGGAGGGLAIKVSGINLVHFLEITEVYEENGSLDDIRQRELFRPQDCRHIVKDASRLFDDILRNDLPGLRIKRHLTGAKAAERRD